MADGRDFPRPDWVSWVAQDSSGAWWGYSAEPLRNDSGWYENEVGDCVRLGHSAPFGWESSLQPVSRTGQFSQKASPSTFR